MTALIDLITEGKESAPRGKRIKELRPVIFEYLNPKDRVTMLKGRVINPFFQLAEALWILRGRSDVEWLAQYNKNMSSFSDNGVDFNAPYGERLRYWGRNNSKGYLHNPLDQLYDAFKRLMSDQDTRQAYCSIYNPEFDHSGAMTVDRPCNVGIDFKIREGKLDIVVFNRSNDLHWGTFGANLCQFATIQEAMASWLGVEVGTYSQITNSLHVYLEDYGAKETSKVLKAYGLEYLQDDSSSLLEDHHVSVSNFTFPDEPRITSYYDSWHMQVDRYFSGIDPYLSDGNLMSSDPDDLLFQNMISLVGRNITDGYLKMTVYSMFVYKAHTAQRYGAAIFALRHIVDCTWKVSMLRFLSKRYLGLEDFREPFRSLYNHLNSDIIDYIERKGE
jgi:thymidylate synthase